MNHLQVSIASCNFEVIDIQACTGRRRNTLAILNPINITSEGALYITSNCSLSSYKLFCGRSKYTLEILTSASICEVSTFHDISSSSKLPIQVFYLKINYVFYGDIDPIKYLTQARNDHDTSSLFNVFTSNTNFIGGVGTILSLITLLPHHH